MAIARTALLVSASIAAPTLLLQPPLKTGTSEGNQPSYAVQRLSSVAIAGHALYRKQCQRCHGEGGSGTAYGPSLVEDGGPSTKFQRMTFHLVVRQGHAPQAAASVAMPASGLSYNQIELIARFIREAASR